MLRSWWLPATAAPPQRSGAGSSGGPDYSCRARLRLTSIASSRAAPGAVPGRVLAFMLVLLARNEALRGDMVRESLGPPITVRRRRVASAMEQASDRQRPV